MPSGKQSLISDIFKKISDVTTITSTLPNPPPSSSTSTVTRRVRLKTRSIRTLRSTSTKPKKKILNPYKKKQIVKSSQQQTLNTCKSNDFVWLGRKLHRKPSNCVRLWVQNINGINRQNNFKHFAEEIITINSVETQIIALTETNLNARNVYVTDQLSSVFDEISPGSQHVLTSTNTSHCTETLQYGGILTLSQGHMAMRVAKKGQDQFGRYQWTQYYGKKHHLRLYNIYRPVIHTDNTAGDGTVWAQHRELLLAAGIDTDPRIHILTSLLQDVQNDIEHQRQVLIVGDFNENVFSSKINETFQQAGLINVVQNHIDDDPDNRSYFRGKHIIDGVWASPLVAENIQ